MATNMMPLAYVMVNVTGTNTTSSIGSLYHADPELNYWIVDLDITNHGYERFVVDPKYFMATRSNINSSIDSATFSLASLGKQPLVLTMLTPSQEWKGSLAFLVSKGGQYGLAYNGPGTLYFHWNAS